MMIRFPGGPPRRATLRFKTASLSWVVDVHVNDVAILMLAPEQVRHLRLEVLEQTAREAALLRLLEIEASPLVVQTSAMSSTSAHT
jgi:hypothetical protein